MKLNIKYQLILKEFDEYIQFKNFRNKDYQAQAKEFIYWLQSQGVGQINEVGSKQVYDYYKYLSTRSKKKGYGVLSESSIHKHLNGVRKLFEFLVDEEYLKGSPHVPRQKINERKETLSLTMEEIKLLYSACKTPTEKALIGLSYGCGLRRNEMVELQVGDVDLYKRTVIVRAGKNSKRREVPIQERVLIDLKDYLCYRSSLQDKSNPVRDFFIGKHKKGIEGQAIYRWFKTILERTQINQDVTLHGLRHSLAEHLREQNAPSDFIRSILGHSMGDTTQIYATKNRMRKAHNLKIMQVK